MFNWASNVIQYIIYGTLRRDPCGILFSMVLIEEKMLLTPIWIIFACKKLLIKLNLLPMSPRFRKMFNIRFL